MYKTGSYKVNNYAKIPLFRPDETPVITYVLLVLSMKSNTIVCLVL